MRLLARADLAALVQTEDRATATGTRSVRVIAPELLAKLALAIAEKPQPERVQKRNREHNRQRNQSERNQGENDTVFTFSGAAPAAASDLESAALIAELRAKIAAQDRMLTDRDSEITFLRSTLQREQESRLNEQRLLASEQQITARRMIEAMPEEPEVKKNGGGSGVHDVRARLKLKIGEPCQIQQVQM